MSEPTQNGVIEVKNLGIQFRLYHERAHTLKEALVYLITRKSNYEDLWALREVSFSLAPGESLGVIGRNGSGKSTLLRVLAGVYLPTEGSVEVKGNISPMIELGAGFNPELTGIENIYLQGALMGFGKRDMDVRMESIIAFSELDTFIDIPIKNYSSGMYLRLGFAIAVHIEPEILLIDEILGVGDASFQAKCKKKMKGFKEGGATIVFVTHDLDGVKRMCDRVILLDAGRILHEGDPEETVERYEAIVKGEK
ncbi:MAG: ABC transporter ATP-binding protein [Planctomycetota bacterium]|jgi:ABC-type polysaccharide/polyol phosphate transport system ATPase subunit